MKNTLLLTAMAVAVLGLSACKEKSTATVSSTDASGTTTQSTVTKDVEQHRDGSVTGTVDTKTTVDPPGMMNKETVNKEHEEVR